MTGRWSAPRLGTAWLTDVVGLRVILWVGIAVWFLGQFVVQPSYTGIAHDWAYYTHHTWSTYLSVFEYGQLPVWDPYWCGGMPSLGNVNSNAASLPMILQGLLGLYPGRVLGFVLYFALGAEGAYQYARHKGSLGLGAVVAGLVFAFSGRFVNALEDGQPGFFAFHLVPWVFLCFERGLRAKSYRWPILGGAFMAWMFFENGAIATSLTSIVLLVLLIMHTASHMLWHQEGSRWFYPLRSLSIMTATATVLSAPRFFLVVESLIKYPRVWAGRNSLPFNHVWNMLFEPTLKGGYWGIGTSYIGLLSFFLFAYALLRRNRAALSLGVLCVATFSLALGQQDSALGLWNLVKMLPVLENLRAPFRFTFFISFFVAVGASLGLTLIEQQLRSKIFHGWHALVMFLPLLFIASLVSWQTLSFNHKRVLALPLRPPPLRVDPEDAMFRQSVGNRWMGHNWPMAGLGSINCFEEQPFFTSPGLRGDLLQEEYLEDPALGSVQRIEWTPHRIVLDVELEATGIVLVNQNTHRGWTVDRGRVLHDREDGLLAIEAPPGSYQLVIRFSDPVVTVGILIALLGLFGYLGFELVLFRRRRRAGDSESDEPRLSVREP